MSVSHSRRFFSSREISIYQKAFYNAEKFSKRLTYSHLAYPHEKWRLSSRSLLLLKNVKYVYICGMMKMMMKDGDENALKHFLGLLENKRKKSSCALNDGISLWEPFSSTFLFPRWITIMSSSSAINEGKF